MESTPYYVLFVALPPIKLDDPVYYYPVYGDTDILQVEDVAGEHMNDLYLTKIRELNLSFLKLEQTYEV